MSEQGQRQAPRDPFGLLAGGEGTITGMVVCAAAIAYAAGHAPSVWSLCGTILGTVAVYWVAHLHAMTIGSALTRRHHPVVALRHALRETWPIVGASAVPIAALLGCTLLGARLATAAWVALLATVALLTGYSYLAAARAGLDTRDRITSAVAGLFVGLLVVLLKVGLH
ncbi:MAG TPA: hypothetical protein VFG88_08375 [Nocardioidaceae bacterium]|nr:hypothetical protein [Nocardioidaceae bacterium]